MISPFRLIRATSLDDASAAVAEGAVPYVGGTELVGAMQLGLVAPEALVDLKTVAGLDRIDAGERELTIGAAARHDEIAEHEAVRSSWPVLAVACAELGNQRVRATGSIGGNLCWSDPRSDVTTALIALDATVTLYSTTGRRTVQVGDFVLGAMETDLHPLELLESIHVPRATNRQVYVRHQPTEYPTLTVALVHPEDGPLRITVGAVCERPRSISVESIADRAVEEFVASLDVIADLNGSEEYKRHLTSVFLRRAEKELREREDG